MNFKALIAILAISTANLFASNFQGKQVDQELEVNYSFYQDNWIMGLSDGSCWELMPLKEKRKQSWSEWWSGTTPKEWDLGEEFFFDRANWKGKYTITVYEAADSLATGYDFILMNEQNGQKAFARFVPHGADLIPKIEYAKSIIEQADTTSARVLRKYRFTDNLLVLDDQTTWKLDLLNVKSRSFGQWWNGEVIDQPDPEFLSQINDWHLFDEIVVYHVQFDNNPIFEKYHISKRDQKVFLVENMTTKKLTYATSVAFQNLLQSLEKNANDQRVVGYNQGWHEGYRRGYSVGFKEGEEKGKTIIEIRE